MLANPSTANGWAILPPPRLAGELGATLEKHPVSRAYIITADADFESISAKRPTAAASCTTA